MMIDLHEICIRYSWRNTNSKCFSKIWLLVNYSLLVVTQRCVVRTSMSVSNGAVSCHPASMVNFICFTDEKSSLCQH